MRVAYLTLRGPLAGNSNARDRIRTALAAHTEIESVLGSTELDGLHAGPKLGDLVAEARPPWSFAKADLPAGTLKAAHGSRAELDVPLYLAGAGVRRTKPSQPRIIDVAPTISALLGMPCPAQAQGRPLSETFTSPAACPASSSPRTLVFALGDGADGSSASRALARYVASQRPDRFFYLGDVYERGTAREFASRYEPLYGGLAPITDPVAGNHEYRNRGVGYLPYWRRKRGWSAPYALHRSYVDARSGWQVIAYSSEADPRGREHLGGEAGRATRRDVPGCDRAPWPPRRRRHRPRRQRRPAAGVVAARREGRDQPGRAQPLYGRLAPIRGVTVLVSGAGGHNVRSLGRQHHPVRASETHVPTVTRLELSRGRAEFAQLDKNGSVYDSGRRPIRRGTISPCGRSADSRPPARSAAGDFHRKCGIVSAEPLHSRRGCG